MLRVIGSEGDVQVSNVKERCVEKRGGVIEAQKVPVGHRSDKDQASPHVWLQTSSSTRQVLTSIHSLNSLNDTKTATFLRRLVPWLERPP